MAVMAHQVRNPVLDTHEVNKLLLSFAIASLICPWAADGQQSVH